MKNLIYLLRENNVYYLIALIIVFVSLIGSAIWTSVSLIWGQRLLIVCLSTMIYLMVFLGVNPIIKGMSLTLIPSAIIIILPELLKLIPTDIYEQWISIDTARGRGPVSLFVFVVLGIVIKLSKIKPYIKKLAEQEDVKHRKK
ncbi:hypothetical protein [Gracilibacillus sp. YIM 98692]|uniref:hypothetical protein n=1 Tax=Gracilibacillus sp. YIM 98692 TaxID=2663532 RepID=UPI0013D70DAF|nr:hypothetical protein [Gracilibacillus sp. YIM 98692]